MVSSDKYKNDEHFVELFKKKHNEQFHVLVRMHLSFLLDMTAEESECFYEKSKLRKWNLVPFGKKSKHKHHEGSILSKEVLDQVHQLICFLKIEKNLTVEGIFRRTGSLERQNELKTSLLQGIAINLEDSVFTVHDCASVLKGFLADLPEPVITDIQFPLYCQIAESFRLHEPSHELKILQTIQLLFVLLPKENKCLLQDLFELLHLVTLQEESNRMSSENLAKLFTPHLLCPRKLAPEVLLRDSQMLFGIVAFMITKFPKLFNIPSKLLLDFKSHYERESLLNESVKGAAHTVFTFVDNELTAKENEENVTDSALAQLYAHIQGLPDSSRKRKLVKQFNKQNGHGTPLQVIRSSVPKNKSFSDSIKKHMFHKKLLKNARITGLSQLKNASSEELLNSPTIQHKTPTRARLFCHNFDSCSDDETTPKKLKGSQGTPVKRSRSKSDSDLGMPGLPGNYLTSTPACLLSRASDVFTPDEHSRKSMSPITRSAQRMSRAMQETMMTPRSRKPVLLVSGTNINNLAKSSPTLPHLQEETISRPVYEPLESKMLTENTLSTPQSNNDEIRSGGGRLFKSKSDGVLKNDNITSQEKFKPNKTDSPKSLSTNFKHYLNSRDIVAFDSPTDSSFSSRSDDFQSYTEGPKNESIYLKDHCDAHVESDQQFSNSMLYILNGNSPSEECLMNDSVGEKELVLKPRQFDENGKPIVFETSF
uniref:Rho-GAP domain-containing protein n=1 Tax=Dendroctonus ponderosae TaxID=77166 RepID=A0AAR5Q4J4_DENPD